MITLFASIAGFVTSLIPEILRFFKDRLDKSHELQLMDKQIRFSKIAGSKSPEEVQMTRDVVEQLSLYSTYKTGINWVDALNGTVRPVLAYSFFTMYAAIKITQYQYITKAAVLVEYIDIIWSIDDQAIFASIVSFYFGQRAFARARKR